MIKGIEHIAVLSKNSEALKDWYVKIFDLKVVYDSGKGSYFVAAPDNSMFEIIKIDDETKIFPKTEGGFRHIAISVTSEQFDDLVDRIRKENVEILSEPTEKNGIRTFFFRDIDGNIFHLIYRPNPLV